MKSIYYAHSLRRYNTEQEQLELKQIAELLPSRKVVNPNGMISDISEAYLKIDEASGVVASEYKHHIGKGVHDEICYALSKKKFVVVLRYGRLFRVYSEHQIEVLDIDWAVYYAKVYEGFYIPPLKSRLTIERVKAKALHPGCGVLEEFSSTAKEFLIRVGRIQLLEELLGEYQDFH